MGILIGYNPINIFQTMKEIKHFNPKCIHLNLITTLIVIYDHLFVKAIYLGE